MTRNVKLRINRRKKTYFDWLQLLIKWNTKAHRNYNLNITWCTAHTHAVYNYHFTWCHLFNVFFFLWTKDMLAFKKRTVSIISFICMEFTFWISCFIQTLFILHIVLKTAMQFATCILIFSPCAGMGFNIWNAALYLLAFK